MFKNIFILLTILTLTNEQTIVDLQKHCDCSDLYQGDCNHMSYWCWWQNDKCVSHNQDCENIVVEEKCGVRYTREQRRCKWQNNSCQPISFSQFSTRSSCLQAYGFWKNSTCSETYTNCEDYDKDACPRDYLFPTGCVVSNDLCQPTVYPDCSDVDHCSNPSVYDYTSKEQRYFCRKIDDKCFKVDRQNVCPSFNGFQEACEQFSEDCTYEEPNCRLKMCSEVLEKEKCFYTQAYGQSSSFNKCEWKDEKCQDYIFDLYYCYALSYWNYVWDFIEQKCQRCKKLVDSIIVNSNQTNSNISTGTNSSTNSGTNSTNNSGSNSTSSSETNSTSSSGTNSTNSSGTNSTSSSGTNSDINLTNNSTTNSTASQTQTSSFGNTICRITFQIVVIVFLLN